MTTKFYVLKDGEEPGIYPGIGDVKAGVPFPVYSPEQEEAAKADGRFKLHRAAEPDATPDADKAPAKGGKK